MRELSFKARLDIEPHGPRLRAPAPADKPDGKSRTEFPACRERVLVGLAPDMPWPLTQQVCTHPSPARLPRGASQLGRAGEGRELREGGRAGGGTRAPLCLLLRPGCIYSASVNRRCLEARSVLTT